jgi:multidrug efflux pump subunit AcrA (membrane-fusion protein)
MKKSIAIFGALAMLTVLPVVIPGCGERKDAKPGATAEGTLYHCPMHPTYTSDRPGDCPICNMSLVKVQDAAPAPAPEPHGGHGPDTLQGAGASPPGYVPVTISPEQQQRIGVRLAAVSRGPALQSIRAVGKVEYDESRLHHVHTRVEGWIDRLYVSTTGEMVKRGDPLFSMYSPELVSAQEEFLLALGPPGEPPTPLLATVRQKLKLLQVSDAQIRTIEIIRRAQTYVDIVAHASGVVVEKRALEGMKAMPGEDLYLLADLSRVWITASIYEYELPLVRVGQKATVTLPSYPGTTFRGRIVHIYPYLDESTRTNAVRFEFENLDLKLKPGMYADVELQVPLGKAMTIPRDAVLDSGERQVVLVAAGEGRFEPREVTLGQRLGDSVVVLRGVKEGEEVVVGAHFLIDSESQLKAALKGFGKAGEHAH